jgi:hypothetical protein
MGRGGGMENLEVRKFEAKRKGLRTLEQSAENRERYWNRS